jgi:PadR family transcriptional regulator PadR
MNGVPELLVLQLLARKEMYGYEIVRAIAASTAQQIAVGEGCVYPILHSMEKNRWVAARSMQHSGRTRIYYRLTEKGEKKLRQASLRWSKMAAAIGAVLGPAAAGEPNV